MNTYQTDVFIHVDESMQTDTLSALQDMLRRVEGVIRVAPSARPHFVRVDYDPRATPARSILECVRQQGLHAQLVCM